MQIQEVYFYPGRVTPELDNAEVSDRRPSRDSERNSRAEMVAVIRAGKRGGPGTGRRGSSALNDRAGVNGAKPLAVNPLAAPPLPR